MAAGCHGCWLRLRSISKQPAVAGVWSGGLRLLQAGGGTVAAVWATRGLGLSAHNQPLRCLLPVLPSLRALFSPCLPAGDSGQVG